MGKILYYVFMEDGKTAHVGSIRVLELNSDVRAFLDVYTPQIKMLSLTAHLLKAYFLAWAFER